MLWDPAVIALVINQSMLIKYFWGLKMEISGHKMHPQLQTRPNLYQKMPETAQKTSLRGLLGDPTAVHILHGPSTTMFSLNCPTEVSTAQDGVSRSPRASPTTKATQLGQTNQKHPKNFTFCYIWLGGGPNSCYIGN